VAARVPVEWALNRSRCASASRTRGSLRPEAGASRDRMRLRGGLLRVGRVPREVTREARRKQGERRVLRAGRDAGHQTTVAVDLNTLDPDSLPKQQCPGESLGFSPKAFGAFRRVDAKEPDSNRAASSWKSHVNGVAINNRRNHPSEGLACEALGPGLSRRRDGGTPQQENADTDAMCPAPRERCLQAHGGHSSVSANQRGRMLMFGFAWVPR
jgi:hypothetical protein